MDSDPAKRNIFGVTEARPELARTACVCAIGQQIIEWLGGKRIHPAWVVPGGVSEPLTAQHRDQILALMPEARRWPSAGSTGTRASSGTSATR